MRHSQNRAFRCFAVLWLRLQDAMLMEMALPSHIHAGRFSCETEKSPQEYACEPMSFSLGGKKVPYFTSYDFKEQALRNF